TGAILMLMLLLTVTSSANRAASRRIRAFRPRPEHSSGCCAQNIACPIGARALPRTFMFGFAVASTAIAPKETVVARNTAAIAVNAFTAEVYATEPIGLLPVQWRKCGRYTLRSV